MAEHAARYGRFAETLTKAGYAVFANDHRGHGKTAGAQENVGYFADENGWEKVVGDMHTLTGIIQKEIRRNLFSFSAIAWGRFFRDITRCYMAANFRALSCPARAVIRVSSAGWVF